MLPTFPIGPGDGRPTPTGKLVLDFLNGKIPAFVDTTLNVVHVDDLAAGHLLALERGDTGRSYIVGGENMGMGPFLAGLAAATGLPAPKLQVPRSLALGVGALSQLVEGRILKREPFAALEAARMSTTNMMFSDARARQELGYSSRPTSEAMADAARWFAENGYVKPERLRRMHLQQSTLNLTQRNRSKPPKPKRASQLPEMTHSASIALKPDGTFRLRTKEAMARTHTNYAVTFAVLATAALAFSLLQSLILPAIPQLEHTLHTSETSASWLLTAYLLSAAIATPILGRIGDMVGKEKVIAAVLVALSVGSLISALATTPAVDTDRPRDSGCRGRRVPARLRDHPGRGFPAKRVAGAIGVMSAILGLGAGAGIVLAGPILVHPGTITGSSGSR